MTPITLKTAIHSSEFLMMNSVSSDMNNKLYCEPVHNSPHAEFITGTRRRSDDPKKFQGDSYWIWNCNVCHGGSSVKAHACSSIRSTWTGGQEEQINQNHVGAPSHLASADTIPVSNLTPPGGRAASPPSGLHYSKGCFRLKKVAPRPYPND